MSISNDNLSLFLSITVLSVIAFIILFKIYIHITEKYFLDEFTWLLQKTIFRSYFIFKFTILSVFLLYVIIAIYSVIFTPYWYYGIFISLSLSYFFYKTIKSRKEGKLSLRDDFFFQKYSTKVSFYNNQTEEYRRKSFESIIDKIKRTELNGITDTAYKNYLFENFILRIDRLLTFEYYDNKLYNSISDHYTATLFYRKYLKNVLEIISRIDKQTDNLTHLNNDYQTISEILLNIKMIRFDDNQGLHYDISLVDLEIEKILNNENDDFSIEKSLLILSSSIENLKLVFAENNLISSLSEKSDNILQALSDIKVSLEKNLKNNKHLLKFAGDSKKIYPLFERYLDLKYKNDERLKEFKIQFIKFVKFFTDEKVYEDPSINSFDAKDVKYLMGFFSYLNAKKIAEYKNFDLVHLILKITKQEIEIKNTSIEHALRNPAFKLSEWEEKSINSVYNRLFKS